MGAVNASNPFNFFIFIFYFTNSDLDNRKGEEKDKESMSKREPWDRKLGRQA